MSKNYIRYALLISKVLLIAILIAYNPVHAQAPIKENSQALYAQTLLNDPYTNNNFNLSEQTKNKYLIYLETQKQGLLYGDFVAIRNLAQCESALKHESVYGDKGKAYGIFQYHKRTFDLFKQKANKENLDYTKAEDQIELTIWAYKKGLMDNWSCWNT